MLSATETSRTRLLERRLSRGHFCCSPKCWLLVTCVTVLIFILLAFPVHQQPHSQSLATASLQIDPDQPPEVVVLMDDRVPSYKLATMSHNKPYADGDHAQAKVLEELRLYETCQKDPSTLVVDVGAFLGRTAKPRTPLRHVLV